MRDEKYDVARAIAIYFVVVGHVLISLNVHVFRFVLFFHMPLFFFISGYFLNSSIKKYCFGTFLKKKVKTLIVPFLVWSLISFAMNILLLVNGGNFNLKNVIEQFVEIFLYARSLWFLVILFFSSVFLALFVYSIKCKYMGLLFCAGSWLILSFFLNLVNDNILAAYKFKWLFPFLLIGYCFSESPWRYSISFVKSGIFCTISLIIYILLTNLLYTDAFFEAYSTFTYTNIEEMFAGMVYYMISIFGIYVSIICSQKLLNLRMSKYLKFIGGQL
ncbi:MAG: acyltransferase family protein [Clostridiales bacterium]|nr:acyltransferase family protein [Clostridiales bacterium]